MKNDDISKIAKKIVEIGCAGKPSNVVIATGNRPYIVEENHRVTYLADEVLDDSSVQHIQEQITTISAQSGLQAHIDINVEEEVPSMLGTWEEQDKEMAIQAILRCISSLDGFTPEITRNLFSSLGNDTFDSFHFSFRTSTGALIPLYKKDFENLINVL